MTGNQRECSDGRGNNWNRRVGLVGHNESLMVIYGRHFHWLRD